MDRVKEPAALPSAPLDLGAERAEQRRRREHRGGDRDSLRDGLRGVADRVQPGEHLRGLPLEPSPDISAMPCALSDTGPKVSIDTITPTVVSRPVPASADGKQGDGRVSGAEQEREVDRAADQQGRVHGRLEPDRNAGQDDGGRARQRALADFPDRLAVGLGEVAGQQLDGAGQDQADEGPAPMASRRGFPLWCWIAVLAPLRPLKLDGR